MTSKKSSLVYLPDLLHVFALLLASRILLSAQLLPFFCQNHFPWLAATFLMTFPLVPSARVYLILWVWCCTWTGVLAGFKTSLPALITGSGRDLKPCLIQVTSSLSVGRKRGRMFVFACSTPKHFACLGVGFLSRWLGRVAPLGIEAR